MDERREEALARTTWTRPHGTHGKNPEHKKSSEWMHKRIGIDHRGALQDHSVDNSHRKVLPYLTKLG